MKIRKGFVSNSSSSSFILCLSPDVDLKKVKVRLERTIDISKLVEKEYSLRNIKEFKQDVEDDLICMCDDEYEKCIKELENGNIIIDGVVGTEYVEEDADILFSLFGYNIEIDGGEFISPCDGY